MSRPSATAEPVPSGASMRGAKHDALVPRPCAASRLPASAAAPPADARIAARPHARGFDLRPWASASFVGARHIFPFALAAGDAKATARALQDQLGAAELELPGP